MMALFVMLTYHGMIAKDLGRRNDWLDLWKMMILVVIDINGIERSGVVPP